MKTEIITFPSKIEEKIKLNETRRKRHNVSSFERKFLEIFSYRFRFQLVFPLLKLKYIFISLN
jgi:hypothetical protein